MLKSRIPNPEFGISSLRGLLLACAACVVLVAVFVSSAARAATGVRVRAEAAHAPHGTEGEAGAQAARLTPDEEALNREPLRLPLVEPKIVVGKKARRLTLYSGGRRVRVYAVALGFTPEGDKERQGDGRTPEGSFRVCTKNDRSKFYLSLGLNYPDADAAERGLRDGVITRAEAARIRRAAADKTCPPWDTALGGEIFIHGGGAASDWTAGCVALENGQIKELFDAAPRGALVVVEP